MKKTLMRDLMTRLAGSMAIVLLTAGVFASPQASAQITGTKHNLGSGGTGANTFSGTGEICVFCHTPHGADVSASVPLWNRTLGTTTYTTYNSLGTSSLDGATAPVGSVSLACLSCHDGATAMNVMINAPGSGLAGDAAFQAGSWTGSSKVTGVAAVGAGVDSLVNDHPIGIQYGGGMPGTGGQFTKAAIAAGGLKDLDFKGISYSNLNNNDVWWVDSGTVSGSRDKADMQLYTRTGALAMNADGKTVSATVLAGSQAFVECASCHDPHSALPTFLRISNSGSAVCLACHTK